MALAGHQFPRALAVAFGTSAAQEAPMVQEELQQVQIRPAEVPAQGEVGAQPSEIPSFLTRWSAMNTSNRQF